MLGTPTESWRDARREAAREEILRVAGEVARKNGLAGLSLRDVTRRLGMAAPSLYAYFDSKAALYDAMFAAGYRQKLEEPVPRESTVRAQLDRLARDFVDFSVADPVRYQLLFQRTIPGFTPSPQSWELAQEVYRRGIGSLLGYPGVRPEDLDLVTAVLTGLVDQQLSNDPGGDRWLRLLDDAVDMLATRLESRARAPADTSPGADPAADLPDRADPPAAASTRRTPHTGT